MNMTPIKFGTDVSPVPSDHARSFGATEALTTSPEAPLGYTGLQVTGPDAGTFLQGQMTADVTALAPGQCQMSALCDPKGRVIAQMDIARTDDETFALILAHRLSAAVSATLSKYVMRSKVTIKPWPGHAHFSLSITDQAPVSGQCLLSPDQTLVCRPSWLPPSDPHWVLTNSPVEAGQNSEARDLTWAHAHVLFGLAPPVTATDLQHIPQMLNLDALEGISMTKGCYTGQEIIARVHHRGSVKRRLRRFLADATSGIKLGSTIESATGGNAGSVVEVARDDHDQLAILAVVKESEYSPEQTLNCNGVELKQWALPYAV